MPKQKINLIINDLDVQATYYSENVSEIFLPLLRYFSALYQNKKERIVILLAAAPGTGKSTLVALLEHLSKQYKDIEEIQSLQMDGFHYPNSYLLSHHIEDDHNLPLLKTIKGHESTFDVNQLINKLQSIKKDTITWPIYSRSLHDVSDQVINVTSNIVLIEGNYLLLNKEPWNQLKQYADYTIFITADPTHLKQHLIQRKVMGGSSLSSATEHYEKVDRLNVINVLNNSNQADLTLSVDEKKMFYVMCIE